MQRQIGRRRAVDDRLEALRGAKPRHRQQYPDMRQIPVVPFGLALGMPEIHLDHVDHSPLPRLRPNSMLAQLYDDSRAADKSRRRE